MLVRPGVPECAEHHVYEREVTVIKGVYALSMVQGMPFGTLYYIAQPLRGPDVAVLEYREEGHG